MAGWLRSSGLDQLAIRVVAAPDTKARWNTAKVRSGYWCIRTVAFTEWKRYGSEGIYNCWR